MDLSAAMHAILQGGVSLVPVGKDKRPTIKWKEYQGKRASTKMLDHWLATHEAFAMVCGAVSGGLEIIDFDSNPEAQPQPYTAEEFFDAWRNNAQVAPIIDRYPFAIQRTGGGGFQVAYRCPNPGGNQKLAWIPDDTQEHGRSIAIEDRGEGGYAVAAPSLHPTGNYYQMLQGDFAEIPTITQEERNALLDAARRLDLMPYTKQDLANAKRQNIQSYNGTGSVIEAFNTAHSVKDLLLQHGYTEAGRGRLVRPGGESGSVVILDSDNVAFPWSSNDPLHRSTNGGNPSPVDPFDVYAFYDHGGDKKNAAKAAARLLGMERPQQAPSSSGELPIAPSDVISAIRLIADRERIIKEFACAIGDMERSQHGLVVDALYDVGFGKGEARDFVKACLADAKVRRKAERRAAAKVEQREDAIQTNDRQLADVVSDAVEALRIANGDDPTLFVRGGVLARIATDENGQRIIQEVTAGAMLGILADAAHWQMLHVSEEGRETTRDVYPPREVITAVVSRGEWPFPGLLGVVNAPVFSREGVLHGTPGYDAKTRLHYTGGVIVGDISPSRLQWAKDLILRDLLVDFPFRDDASVAHALSYMLTPFVRDLIPGPTPPHMVDAPSAGTGKGLLVNACAHPFLGRDVPSMTAPKDDDEWRKKITSALMSGETHIVIDNVNHELDSGSLATAWTQPVWKDRMLGSNREVGIPIRAVWAITANNVKMSQELARRCVWLRLDANAERPWTRTGFKHDNLTMWAKDNRDDLVTAALTLVNAWINAGRPLFTERTKGSYEAWARVIGGILAVANVPGFLANEEELYQNVVSRDDALGDFVKAWLDKQAERKANGLDWTLSAQDLFKLASVSDSDAENQLGGWENLLGDLLGSGNAQSRKTRLGNILSEHQDKVFAGHKIKNDRRANGMKHWRLEPLLSREEKLLKELQV